jgi:hypothetical protein
MALPLHIDRLVYRPGATEAGAVAVVSPGDGSFDALVVDADGNGLVHMEGYRTVQLPGSIDEAAAAPLHSAMSPQN